MRSRAELHRFMVQQTLGVVSSIGPNGTPQSALVGIATALAWKLYNPFQDSLS